MSDLMTVIMINIILWKINGYQTYVCRAGEGRTTGDGALTLLDTS